MKKSESIQILMMGAFLVALFVITDDFLNKLYLDSVDKSFLANEQPNEEVNKPAKAETSE